MRIKVTTNFPDEPILRQTPGRRGQWGDSQFFVDEGMEECDYWVVLDALRAKQQAVCRSGRTVLLTMEPEGAKSYSPAFLKQFDLVITGQSGLVHPNIRHSCQGLPWHVGLNRGPEGSHGAHGFKCEIDYDGFKAMQPPPKEKLLSVLCSVASQLPGHRNRLRFVELLRAHFKDQLEVFGRGSRPVGDKWEAIVPYKYHIVLENTTSPYYLSEKIQDCFLGFAYPIYWGCHNVGQYFDPRSFATIDIDQPEEAVRTIASVIEQGRYESQLPFLVESRGRVLDRYNTFAVVSEACRSLPAGRARKISLKPERYFGRWRPRRIVNALALRLHQLRQKMK